MAPWPVLRKKWIIATLVVSSTIIPLLWFSTPEVLRQFPVDNAAVDFRQLLSTVNPLDRLPHSKTLGVAGSIYVIGLPLREDRRNVMRGLEKAMGK
jgi:hypothetical protein